jgi:hypothetical protein
MASLPEENDDTGGIAAAWLVFFAIGCEDTNLTENYSGCKCGNMPCGKCIIAQLPWACNSNPELRPQMLVWQHWHGMFHF